MTLNNLLKTFCNKNQQNCNNNTPRKSQDWKCWLQSGLLHHCSVKG